MSNIDEAMVRAAREAVMQCNYGGVMSVQAVVVQPGEHAQAQASCALCGSLRAAYAGAIEGSTAFDIDVSGKCTLQRIARGEGTDVDEAI